jgi:molybdate transport system substrate-binding protein
MLGRIQGTSQKLTSVLTMLGRVMCVVGLGFGASTCGADSNRTITIFAASSLTDVFEVIESDFEAANPTTDVVVSYGGSSSLVAQIREGAPADVLAVADMETMRSALANGSVGGDSVTFATNSLAIAVAPGNPSRIEELADLETAELVIVLAAPEVPAGRYTNELLSLSDVTVLPVSYEQSVRAVLTKVVLGEADAGLVYRTDAVGRADVELVGIDIGANVVARYEIASTQEIDAEAASFIDFVLSERGRAILEDVGFGTP